MANPPKPWKVEYARSGRSSCKTCQSRIRHDQLRLGKMVRARQFDGFMASWNHANCVLKKPKRMKLINPDDIEGIELLRWEDQQKIRQCAQQNNPDNPPVKEYRIEVSQTSRATCKLCNQKITEEQVRISSKPKGKKGVKTWHHANCFMEQSPATELEKILGWDDIPSAEQTAVLAQIKNPTSSKSSGTKDEVQDDKESVQPYIKDRGLMFWKWK